MSHHGFTRTLGLIGFEPLEPVLLASLATGTPLLLIGNHGSGKTLLLERIAEALKLQWRHYNASLVNFDDLVGYPVPDADGNLRFIETPASIWGAEAVFIDEISRARIDIQNRLFPIIHERKVQGLPLTQLRHRWAALNPPVSDDDTVTAQYAGSQALDVALADRFAFHVTVPDWRGFSDTDKEAVILASRHTVPEDAGIHLQALIDATAGAINTLSLTWSADVARYVRIAFALLDQAGVKLSARRANLIAANIIGLEAGRHALGLTESQRPVEASAFLALQTGLPLKASGLEHPEGKLLAIHREAWRLACIQVSRLQETLLLETDPVNKLTTLFNATEEERASLPDGELTTVVIDSLQSADWTTRCALGEWLFEKGHVQLLSVVAADEVASLYKSVACTLNYSESVRMGSGRHKLWQVLTERLTGLDVNNTLAERAGNVLVEGFKQKAFDDPKALDSLIAAYVSTRNSLFKRNDSVNDLFAKKTQSAGASA